MEVMHYSQEWDNAGMPHSIFFTSRGHAVHGSDHPGLGAGVAWVRRCPSANASTLTSSSAHARWGRSNWRFCPDKPPQPEPRNNTLGGLFGGSR